MARKAPFRQSMSFLFNMLSIYLVITNILGLPNHLPQQDIIMLIDNTMDNQQFQLAQETAVTLLDYTSVSPSTSRVGIITFGQKATIHRRLDQTINRECIVKTILRLKNDVMYFDSRLTPAFTAAGRLFNTQKRRFLEHMEDGSIHSSNSLVKRIVILLTNDENAEEIRPFHFRRFPSGVRVIFIIVGKFLFPRPSTFLRYLLVGNRNIQLYWIPNKNKIKNVIERKLLQRIQGSYRTCDSYYEYGFDECQRKCRCSNGMLTDCHRIRKEFTQLSREERAHYINIFKTHSTDKEFSTSHNKFTKLHGQFFCSGIHKIDHFFPWHRWYVWEFENLLRRIDCRVTVPYWDWSYWKKVWSTPGIHIWGSGKHQLGSNGLCSKQFCVQDGPFSFPKWRIWKFINSSNITGEICQYVACGNCFPHEELLPCLRRSMGTKVASKSIIQELLQLSSDEFLKFEGGVRFYLHNLLHSTIGGNMDSIYASVTPEFYMHHTFLDKIWHKWQISGPDKMNVYFKNKREPMQLGSPFSQRVFLNSLALPGCVKVKYSVFNEKNTYQPSGQEKTIKNCTVKGPDEPFADKKCTGPWSKAIEDYVRDLQNRDANC